MKILRYIPAVVGLLLGLAFITFSMMFFLDKMPKGEPPPAGSAPEHFFKAVGPTGYMRMVKCVELGGGILTAIPWTRNFGLLLLVPVLVNIAAYHLLVAKDGLPGVVIGLWVMALYLMWDARKKIAGLLNRGSDKAAA